MNDRMMDTLREGLKVAALQPRFLVLIALLVILPLLFLYSGQQFLAAAVLNQDKLQRDQVDTLHDSFTALLTATNYDEEAVAAFITTAAEVNPTVEELRYVRQADAEFVVEATFTRSGRTLVEATPDAYRSAQVRFGETTIFPFLFAGERYWQAVRAFENSTGDTYYLLSIHSLRAADQYIESNEYRAYLVLFGVYLVILLLAWWHMRQVSYEHQFRALEQTMATRDQFTNIVAHELRAPLSAMRGYASMVRESNRADEESKRYAANIEGAAERLLTIVNDLLEVARLQSGKLSLTLTNVSLVPVLTQVCNELFPSAEEKHIELSVSAPADATVRADGERLHQVFTNLVSNAIKYTPKGKITVRVGTHRDTVEVRIEDTGMGIAAEDQQKLFAPFFRVEGSEMQQITGTGLGMWITKQLLEQMNATVTVESIKGVGTHVIVRLPSA